MRVLYLNPFSQQVSGPDESLLALLSGLRPRGVDAHLVLPRPGPYVSRYEALGVHIHYAPLTILRRRMAPGAFALLPWRLARGVAAVMRIARRENVDLIHTNMEVVLDGSFASKMLRIPHVLHYRGNTLDRPALVFDALTRFWAATSSRILCISNATAEIFLKRSRGEKVEALYNPVDVQAFASAVRSAAVRTELGASPDDILVGTVGRVHPRKDVETFLRACALARRELPLLRCVVVGAAEGEEERAYLERLRALAASLRLEVLWAGARRDIPQVLKALDVFVLASRNEGFGRVVAEATAAGLPLVLTREGALPELAAGLQLVALAEPATPASFAYGIRRVVLAGASSNRAHPPALVHRYGIDAVTARVMSVYEEALRSASPGRGSNTGGRSRA